MLPEYEKLVLDFIAEAEDLLDQSESLILQMEDHFDEDSINSVFRFIHTVKGNSGMFELKNIAALSHKMESLLDLLRSGKLKINKEMIDLLLESLDKLKSILKDIENEKNFSIDDLSQRISTYLESDPSQETEQQPPPVKQMVEAEIDDDLFRPQIQKAEQENKYLSYMVLDLSKQKFHKLNELVEILQEYSEQIIDGRIIEQSIALEHPGHLEYQILYSSDEDPQQFIDKTELRVEKYTPLHTPQNMIAEKQENQPAVQEPIEKMSHPDKLAEPHLKVKIQLLDDLINLVGETIITRNQLLQRSALINDSEGNVVLSRLSQLITQLHEKIMHTRLQELNIVYQRINRIVRDTARLLGKKIRLSLDGGEVELDKTMIDTLIDTLVHILKNSIDHGIEMPEERMAAGKSEYGTIAVSASLQTGNVRLVIADDGKGLNLEKIKNSSIKKGLISEEEASKLSREEIEELIFHPGVSTAKLVTETSGRGVGMDAVRTSFKKIGGNVHLNSVEGKGVTLVATIPQTVSVISCLIISVMKRRFALFQKYISELIKFDAKLHKVVNGHRMYKLRDKLIPIINLKELLYPEKDNQSDPSFIVVVKSETYFFGLLFDEMLGTEEIVIKPLGEHFQGIKLFSGATIMGDGEAVLILDAFGIAEFSGLQMNIQENRDQEQDSGSLIQESGYLLFESSGQRFVTISSSVVSIEKFKQTDIEHLSGIEIVQFKNDIVPLVRLEEIYAIPPHDLNEEIYVVMTQINSKNIGILIHRIIDVIGDIEIIQSENFRGEGILGHTLLDKHTVLVIDTITLLTKIAKERFKWLGQEISSY